VRANTLIWSTHIHSPSSWLGCVYTFFWFFVWWLFVWGVFFFFGEVEKLSLRAPECVHIYAKVPQWYMRKYLRHDKYVATLHFTFVSSVSQKSPPKETTICHIDMDIYVCISMSVCLCVHKYVFIHVLCVCVCVCARLRHICLHIN